MGLIYTPELLKQLFNRLVAVDRTIDRYRFEELFHTEGVGVPGMIEYLQNREEQLGITREPLIS